MTGLPAARFGDMHDCPMCTPTPEGGEAKPHVGGVLIGPGSPNIWIEGARASLLADYAACVGNGSLDLATQGAATVLMNGLPAVRMTDATYHAGAIRLGAFRTRIGGPTFFLPPNIYILGPADYQNRVIRDIFCFWRTKAGKYWLGEIAKGGLPVIIEDRDGQQKWTAYRTEDGATIIEYDSKTTGTYENGTGGGPMPAEPQSALAHELIHAGRVANGDYKGGTKNANQTEHEETAATKGFDGKDGENQVREQMGLPPRLDHKQNSGGPWDGPPSKVQRPGPY